MEIHLPLVVDLDGTLTLSDTLYESFAKFLFQSPMAALGAALHLARGPAAVKRYIAKHCRLDPATLPYRTELIEIVKAETARGRSVHLVTAADQTIADDVARHLGLFASAAGSDGRLNLKGPNKLAYLREKCPDGYIYAGDGSADLPVFRGARGVILCDVAGSTAAKVAEAGVPVHATLRRTTNPAQAWRRAFRAHQRAKNLLLFVPSAIPGPSCRRCSALRCCAFSPRQLTSSTISPTSTPTARMRAKGCARLRAAA
jgi:phosphoglycolate phosphatase-like HAD superfamily hydrolase